MLATKALPRATIYAVRLATTPIRFLMVSSASNRESAAQQERQQIPPSSEASTATAPQQPLKPKSKPSQGDLVQCILDEHPFEKVPLIDIAINLTDDSFDKDRADIVRRAHQAGLKALILTGCCLRTSKAAMELCDASDTHDIPLYFTAGVHPHSAKTCDTDTLAELRRLAAHPKCVALGETGLDFNRNFSPPDVQERWFAAQIELAAELGLPLLLHCRDAGDRFEALLRRHWPRGTDDAHDGNDTGDNNAQLIRGVLHCFTGNERELRATLALGLHVGITGWVCDDRPERGGAELAALVSLIPDDRLMIETDGPYLVPRTLPGPGSKRPRRNEPALLPWVASAVAAARKQGLSDVAAMTTANAVRLFGLRDIE